MTLWRAQHVGIQLPLHTLSKGGNRKLLTSLSLTARVCRTTQQHRSKTGCSSFLEQAMPLEQALSNGSPNCTTLRKNMDEVLSAIQNLKVRKTSGISGVSTEFLRALVQLDGGLRLLASHLNSLLTTGPYPMISPNQFA